MNSGYDREAVIGWAAVYVFLACFWGAVGYLIWRLL